MIKSVLRYYKMSQECCVYKIYIKGDVGENYADSFVLARVI